MLFLPTLQMGRNSEPHTVSPHLTDGEKQWTPHCFSPPYRWGETVNPTLFLPTLQMGRNSEPCTLQVQRVRNFMEPHEHSCRHNLFFWSSLVLLFHTSIHSGSPMLECGIQLDTVLELQWLYHLKFHTSSPTCTPSPPPLPTHTHTLPLAHPHTCTHKTFVSWCRWMMWWRMRISNWDPMEDSSSAWSKTSW